MRYRMMGPNFLVAKRVKARHSCGGLPRGASSQVADGEDQEVQHCLHGYAIRAVRPYPGDPAERLRGLLVLFRDDP